MKYYIYPKFPAINTNALFRIGGSGLANCMFVIARSWILESKYNYKIIEPTWLNFSLRPYLHNEKDKRHYFKILKKTGIGGIKKCLLLLIGKEIRENEDIGAIKTRRPIIIVAKGLKDYFASLIPYQELIKHKFENASKIHLRDDDFENCIGIHIRLGDFEPQNRTPVEWYIDKIIEINKITNSGVKFLLFSDGSDDELKSILNIENVHRSVFGNAFADILALSKCKMILGSDSTFSGWAAFIGQKLSLFNHKHYGKIMISEENELIIKTHQKIPPIVVTYLLSIFK